MSLLGYLPREAATVQEVMGNDVRWGDNEYLLALVVDWLGHIDYVLTAVNSEKGKGPRKPPPQVKRPGDISTTPGVVGTVNLDGSETIKAGALSFEQMERVIEQQTGIRGGVARGD